jgi:hypothetical protein
VSERSPVKQDVRRDDVIVIVIVIETSLRKLRSHAGLAEVMAEILMMITTTGETMIRVIPVTVVAAEAIHADRQMVGRRAKTPTVTRTALDPHQVTKSGRRK